MFDSVRVVATRCVRMMVLAMVVGAVASCSTGTGTEKTPAEARISIEGENLANLQLVVSRDFFQTYDSVNEVVTEVIVQADTIAIDGPYDEVWPLTELGSIVVELINPEPEVMAVHVRVWVDGSPEYDQSATFSLGASLKFVFVFKLIGF